MQTSALHPPWRSRHRQDRAATLGMWVFLASEALMFGAMIVAFGVSRFLQPTSFAAAGRLTDITIGTANTLLLLTSSFAIAVAAEAVRGGARRLALGGMAAALALGLCFLGLKIVEWHSDIVRNLLPASLTAEGRPGEALFFAYYWGLTGLHALHVTIGLTVIALLAWRLVRRSAPLAGPGTELAALYWHLVDVVWIFLYPLIYLGGRS